jgi:hypothetical protein
MVDDFLMKRSFGLNEMMGMRFWTAFGERLNKSTG